MKSVRQNIYDYDAAVPIAVDLLKRRLTLLDGGSNGSEEADSSNNLNEGENNDAPTITSKKGDNVIDFFPGHGKFKGRVESINPTAPNGECIRVLYEDGDRVDYTQETLDQLMAKASIPIGEVGFVFIKKFGSAGYFNGKVIKVLTNG